MERCSKGGNKERSKLGMKARRDSGLEGYIIHERRDSRLEGYGKEGKQERGFRTGEMLSGTEMSLYRSYNFCVRHFM